MKFGICAGPEHLHEVEELGFDYIEYGVASLAAKSDAEIATIRSDIAASSIKAETYNGLFPGSFGLIQDTSDEEIREYLKRSLSICASLGGKLVVFGSGTARKVPSGILYAEAFLRLTDVARIVGEEAAAFGIEVAIEPLRYAETNIINTLNEGAALVAATAHPNVKLLADMYHVWCNGEPLEEVDTIKNFAHIHISSVDRGFPVMEEISRYQAFVDRLKAVGYDTRISIEGMSENFYEQAKSSLTVLKSL